ncbi:MAG TPA: hypothetical protein VKR32_16670, partial [Puia sp.]|nr:hypothetical protein [Puia sp.]
MKMLRFGIMAILPVCCFGFLVAQNVDDIINKHLDAVGGKTLLAKINTFYVEGTVTAMGADYNTKVNSITGKALKSETEVNGSTIVQCITDTGGWSINPLMGQNDATPMTAEEVRLGKASLDLRGMLYNYQERGFTASLTGREDLQ